MSDFLCGVLALQGSFEKHKKILSAAGSASREVRRPEDLNGLTHLIIPGGESTTMHRLGSKYGLLDPVAEKISNGLPVFGTCAGSILIGTGPPPPGRFSLIPVKVIRNAYGRQKESFSADLSLSFSKDLFKGIFIRAPKFILEESKNSELETLSVFGQEPVLVRYRNILLSSFHPELTDDPIIHSYFLSL